MLTAGRLRDGRTISYVDAGEPAGRPIVLFHGAPGSRLTLHAAHQQACAAGVRLICADRPGIGSSTPVASVTFASVAHDTAELVSTLQLSHVTVAGYSLGGGFAVAFAERHPGLTGQLALFSALVPGAPKATLKNAALSNRALLVLATRAPTAVGAVLNATLGRAARSGGATLEKAMKGAPDCDREALARIGPQTVAADLAEGFSQGGAAMGREIGLYASGSTSHLQPSQVPVRLFHGTADRNVPIEVARWAASQLSGSVLTEIVGAGHLLLLEQPDLLFSCLGPKADRGEP